MSTVTQGLRAVEARVARACERAGRRRADVLLLAVSKLQPLKAIEEAYAAGQRDFGENYAQELRDKAAASKELPDVHWHAIGRLQKNKCKYVAKAASAFHALESLEVAEELGRRRELDPLSCFIEVNLGGESQKGGVLEGELSPFLERVRGLPGISVHGLMGLPPLGESPEAARPYFQTLRRLAQTHGLAGLSMGTTADFEVAIEEGSTCVRVGTAIFGDRPSDGA